MQSVEFSPETQKGGRISPAAKRFPPSPFREAVKPPLLVPVLQNRHFNRFLRDILSNLNRLLRYLFAFFDCRVILGRVRRGDGPMPRLLELVYGAVK